MLLPTSLLAALCVLAPRAAAQSPTPTPCPGSAGPFAPFPQNASRCALANSTLPMLEAFDIFTTTLYQRRNASSIAPFLNPGYINHNPFIADGAAAALRALTTGFTDGRFAVMNRVLPGDNNVGFIHYSYQAPGSPAPPVAIVDIFRMEGPCVAEHWDLSQSVPANATNPHPLFSGPAAPANGTAAAANGTTPAGRARRLRRRWGA